MNHIFTIITLLVAASLFGQSDIVTVNAPGDRAFVEYEDPRQYTFTTPSGSELTVQVGAKLTHLLIMEGSSVFYCVNSGPGETLRISGEVHLRLPGCSLTTTRMGYNRLNGLGFSEAQARDFRNRLIEAYDKAWRLQRLSCNGDTFALRTQTGSNIAYVEGSRVRVVTVVPWNTSTSPLNPRASYIVGASDVYGGVRSTNGLYSFARDLRGQWRIYRNLPTGGWMRCR